ncbi:SDR family NAD(P)-dependent oxidoreductase [Bhargavaea beijingensis]|uniref:Glucose 1-dehydrogenase n=1 Tax=Bhargavaea beijingensis TaxID=426756 RepID=A0ABX9ZGS8_9BACL|nr:glucose 1-dehydrogenase [Bhargavaea beijingensis]MCW1928671.1 glucose 1-dehydrogenase [Bhargavaea beijingensis]RSK36701.1 glucose 1-dehydrogenase [Bhargavaea beijingensis]
MRMKGKTVIVTGAGGGMGQAISRKLLEEGATVAGIDLNEDSMAGLLHDRFTAFAADILDEEAVAGVFRDMHGKTGRIDGLVCAAGIAQAATPITDVSLDQWHRLMNINATSLFILSKEAAGYMKPAGTGSIVTIASVSAARPRPGLQSYIASKGAAESFTRGLAIELAEHGVRANTVHPGPADTGMLSQFTAAGADSDQTRKEIFESSVPLGRLIQPDDIAGGVVYLLSDDASMVTGTTLHIDGGRGL